MILAQNFTKHGFSIFFLINSPQPDSTRPFQHALELVPTVAQILSFASRIPSVYFNISVATLANNVAIYSALLPHILNVRKLPRLRHHQVLQLSSDGTTSLILPSI